MIKKIDTRKYIKAESLGGLCTPFDPLMVWEILKKQDELIEVVNDLTQRIMGDRNDI